MPKWETYRRERGGIAELITVDTDVPHRAMSLFPVLWRVSISFDPPSDGEFPTGSLATEVNSLTKAASEELQHLSVGAYVARVTSSSGLRDLLFYVPQGHAAPDALRGCRVTVASDPTWASYWSYFPDERGWNAIDNGKKVVDIMRVDEASVDEPRSITFAAAFADGEDAAAFARALERAFSQGAVSVTADARVLMSVRMPLALPGLDAVSFRFRSMARAEGAEYRGWSADILRPRTVH